ncbi:MAG TPA: FHA domain-containing protein [Trebonia sp.]|nr:FHA domain-containing protein [Trebonia sp.]
MATCPAGHDSAGDDFCDVCGMRIGAPPAAGAGEACPRCGAVRAGQFCEACGYDFAAASSALPPPEPPSATSSSVAPPPPASAAAWTAVVTADRAYYDRVRAAGGPDAAAISFPAYCPQRRFRLSGTEVRVGRRSASRGIDPEIDLTGPPADPGVSRLHAVLIANPDGTWSIVDLGSENGTQVNGSEIPRGEAVPLRDGDRIHLGGWTAITITRGG